MKIKKEKEALHKIKRNPKYFFKYANQFSKTRSRVGPLLNENGETIKDPFNMGEILRKQYESTFSPPDKEGNKETSDVETSKEKGDEERPENI